MGSVFGKRYNVTQDTKELKELHEMSGSWQSGVNQDILGKLQRELDDVVGSRNITDVDIANLSYLQVVVKEALRVHPPSALLSGPRLSTSDVQLSNAMLIPSNTTAMVNMWHITHDPKVWEEPLVFKPERFVESDGGTNVDVRGSDLRLAPFGASWRVCPTKNLRLVTVNLWVAKLVQNIKWVADQGHPIDFREVLKLSCEMKHPLIAQETSRNIVASSRLHNFVVALAT
ncbi:hypothetical protein Sjap_002262 [Stephania japonica]|uniref:Cytochrome P450 n=1 Tax=Stephania japonica TaxID=461633 RepID=A0AAP0KLI6_9MAGN